MKSIYSAIFCVFFFSVFAQNPEEKYLYAQMLDINAQWEYHKNDCPTGTQFFASDIDAIQAHLYLVCESLLKNTPKHLNEKQLAKRLHLIEVLHDYAEQKIFPTNLYHSTRTPYFVDDFGVHCAVGHLMAKSGYTDLVATIRANENYAYIAEIKTPGVAEWAKDHGFDIEELKWIQPGYWIMGQVFPIGAGANGIVNQVFTSSDQGVVFIGEFDTLNALPCAHIGKLQNNQLSCIGSGLNGILNSVSNGVLGLTAYGLFDQDGVQYSYAYFNQGIWNYENVPNCEGYIAESGFWGGGQNSVEIVLYNPDNPEVKEVWIKVGATTWRKSAQFMGNINKIKASGMGRIYAGKFNQFIVFDENGGVSDTIQVNNAVFKSNMTQISWIGFESAFMPDEVMDFEVINSQIYFAGSAISDSTSSGVLLSRYMNNTVQPILYAGFMMNNDAETPTINSLVYESANASILIGGSFNNNELPMGTLGANLARYQIGSGLLNYVASMQKPVNGIGLTSNNGSIIIGGEFVSHSNQQLSHLGVFGGFVNIQKHTKDAEIQLYPNPFNDIIHLRGVTENFQYQILDNQGAVVHQGTIHGESTIDLSDLSSGVYMLHVTGASGNLVRRIVKH